MRCWIIILIVFYIHKNNCVEVHFEAADSGFFLKHSRQPPVAPEISNTQPSPISPTKIRPPFDSILSIDRFTVVQTTQPVSIRASYGPFSTKQTVPARYIVPDAIDNQHEYINNTSAALIELQQSNMHLDISAHLVRSTITQDSPVLRVLFHAGADPGGHLQRQKICVLLHVSMKSQTPLKGRCMPEGEDGVCVAEVIIPSNWWPSIPPPIKDSRSGIPHKAPQRYAQISYSVFEPPVRNPEQCEPKVQIQPLTTFAQVPLISAITPFKELRADDSLTVLMPQHPLYPMSKMHVPVFLHQTPEQNIASFTMRARVKSGIRILGASVTSEFWNISIEKENTKHTTARVTAFKKEHGSKIENKESNFDSNNMLEIFSWLLEVDDSKETLEGGKIVWSVTYVFDNLKEKDISNENIATDETKKRLIAKLEINKDDIQAVLPMAKNWELMNTAVLTGRQVAQAMKVFIVSQAGKVADVTLQSSCHAEDESVIKVSSSCSSVYVDGSEIRGSSNASIIVKYGTYIGLAKFIVWMPEFPLEVYIADIRLSQIKGWKVFDENHFVHNKQSRRRKKRSYVWGQHSSSFYNNVAADKMSCRARYQQSPVEVYARFLAIDQNSGRISYFISRRTGLRVTDLVQPLLRVADPKIASLKGRILQGKSMGRTDVQVLSPITGRAIGAKEIRVGSDKVSLTKLIVRVVSGLQLTITPDNTIENGYIAETSVTHKLTAQYQEGLLDIDLEFMDGSRTPLRDISVEDYFLLVESLDTEVVAFAPMLASHHPRVIAVGEGNDDLLRVTLLLSEDCRTRKNGMSTKQIKTSIPPLASALASVEVDFNNVDTGTKHEAIQNDGIIGRDRKGFRSNGDLSDIIVGIPLQDGIHHHEPTVQARQHRGNIHSTNKLYNVKKGMHRNMTSMEIGMYVLLTAFCFAIIVFVISCVVYASKFRPLAVEAGTDPLDAHKNNFSTNILLRESRFPKEPTTNAHDWVWLGRSTLDRSSVISEAQFIHSRIRITSNPILNYSNNNSEHRNVTSFDKSRVLPKAVSASYNIKSEDNDYFGNKIQNRNENSIDYRPPVPPHRNIGVRAFVNNSIKSTFTNNDHVEKFGVKYDYQDEHKRYKDVSINCENYHSTEGETENPELNFAIKDNYIPINKFSEFTILQPAEETISPQINNNMVKDKKNDPKELHNAERLIESLNQHQKNAFQFDSLTPKRLSVPSDTAGKTADEVSNVKRRIKSPTNKNANGSSSDEGGFVTSKNLKGHNSKKSRVKRATVVGNPMFSTIEDNFIRPEESLGLDDLDMDYEEIMQYFDNLKHLDGTTELWGSEAKTNKKQRSIYKKKFCAPW